jgi:tyrosinase
MAPAERKNYTDAVLCLTRKPPRLPTAEYPGVRSRFDDFVACVSVTSNVDKKLNTIELTFHSTHINYTLHVHYSGLFLPWHRRFTWLWEQALREECGYTSYLP